MSLQDDFRRVSLDRHLVEVETHIGDRPVMQREPVEQSLQETVVGVKQEASTRLRSRRREHASLSCGHDCLKDDRQKWAVHDPCLRDRCRSLRLPPPAWARLKALRTLSIP